MGLFREEKDISVTYDYPLSKIWDALIVACESLGTIEQKSRLGKYISLKGGFFRNLATVAISLDEVSKNKTKINFSGSSFGGLLQIKNAEPFINEIIESLEEEIEKRNMASKRK